MIRGLALLWIACVAAPLHAQQRSDVIRGRVTTDSGRPILDATVIATRAPDRASFETHTGDDGRYELVVPAGSGDYLVHISAPGRVTLRKRVTRAAAASDTTFLVDAQLALAAPPTLERVRVQARKPKPMRTPDPGTQPGASEVIPDVFGAAVDPNLAGDLTAVAGAIPGVTATTGGISVLGLGSDQNSVTLNGLAFGAGGVPRAAAARLRVSTTTYDPARGWFAGANTNVELGSGSWLVQRTAYATVDAPPLQITDPVARRLGERFTGVTTSVGGSGPIGVKDRYFYSYGVEASRRTSRAVSLLQSDADVLRRAGVSADSIARLIEVIDRVGLPATSARMPGGSSTDRLSVLARFDRAQLDARTFQPPKRTAALTLFGNASRSSPLALGPVALPSRGSRRWDGTLGAQGLFSTYFGRDYLTTLRSAFSFGRSSTSPFEQIPGANVLLESELPDGAGGVARLQLGGGDLHSDDRHWTWETVSETQLYASGHERHRIALTADARLDRYRSEDRSAGSGVFEFDSFGALESGQPSIFTRRLRGGPSEGGAWNAFVALGDLWSVTRAFRIQYGARVEGSVFTRTPRGNPAVENAFGVRTDAAPGALHVSPRFGFTWIRRGVGSVGSLVANGLGTFNTGPTSYIRGGVGEFRSMVSPRLLEEASALTGLPDASRSLRCVGPEVPRPDWRSYRADPASVPTRCLGAATTFADTVPEVHAVDPNYSAPRSWRANLSYQSQRGWLVYSLEGTYSLNLDQPSTVDLNFRNVTAFTTSDDGRPVFVDPSAVVPASGVSSLSDARRSASFGRVALLRSDARSVTRQAIVTVSPDLFAFRAGWMSVAYALSSTRALERGFDGSTFGSPLERTWGRGPLDARHQLTLRGGYAFRDVAVTAFARLASGTPYTPLVAGDVNGDGRFDDRAFIPARDGTDPRLAAELDTLLGRSSREARRCLLRQRGGPAARNSCDGPWSATLNAQVAIAGSVLRLGKHVQSVRLSFANPLAGLDRLLHGSDGAHGWGGRPEPDPVLYYVRGFDPAARRFLYAVNPRFGAADPSRTTAHAPFRVTLDVAFYFTPDVAQQQLARYLGPGRAGRPGPRLTAEELERAYERQVDDPYRAILAEADSLLLSREQVEALQAADRRYRARMDSLWRSLASDFAQLDDRFDVAAAVRRQESAIEAGREITRLDVKATIGDILTPIQLRLMRGVRAMYESNGPITRGGRTLRP